jgi:dTDP-4-dehydrorhamnose reductase
VTASADTGRVAVTGAGGRLGTAVMAELAARGIEAARWSRPEYDLDDPRAAERLVARDRPAVVIHCAAWVDVDGCAREPEVAQRRNADAAAELATALAAAGARLILASTNEVFDGRRTDGAGYLETDEPNPGNSYGSSKLAGELAAAAAYAGDAARMLTVRTAWLFGPGGSDFPRKILAVAAKPSDEPLRVVDDEVGSPTHTPSLARAIVDLTQAGASGVRHIVGPDVMSRYAWAVDLLRRRGVERPVRPVPSSEFSRVSIPPPWGVLGTIHMRAAPVPAWSDVADDYLRAI